MFRRETLACCAGRVSAPDDVRVSVAEPSYHLYIIAVPPHRVRPPALKRAASGPRRRERITLRGDRFPRAFSEPRSSSANRPPHTGGIRFDASIEMPPHAKGLRAAVESHPPAPPASASAFSPVFSSYAACVTAVSPGPKVPGSGAPGLQSAGPVHRGSSFLRMEDA